MLHLFVTVFHVLFHSEKHQKKKNQEALSIKTNMVYNNQNKLLLLSFSRLHSDSLDVESKRSPPVCPAEEGVFLPLQLQHKQVTNVNFCVNQEGEGLV